MICSKLGIVDKLEGLKNFREHDSGEDADGRGSVWIQN
jgi:hypothetical protein